MKRALLALPILFLPTPALATGGFTCRTAGSQPIEVSLGVGHVPGGPLISTSLIDRGRNVPVVAPQWWFDDTDFRLLLADPGANRREVIIKARRNGRVYDGSLWRLGKRHWVRCRES